MLINNNDNNNNIMRIKLVFKPPVVKWRIPAVIVELVLQVINMTVCTIGGVRVVKDELIYNLQGRTVITNPAAVDSIAIKWIYLVSRLLLAQKVEAVETENRRGWTHPSAQLRIMQFSCSAPSWSSSSPPLLKSRWIMLIQVSRSSFLWPFTADHSSHTSPAAGLI